MTISTEELTAGDLELIEFARMIRDAHTDREDGIYTQGCRSGVAIRTVGGSGSSGRDVLRILSGLSVVDLLGKEWSCRS